ncbi:hypothetical protein SAMN04487895_11077 [Paenibacillus sophorae]|uniref:Uncharacterized protein n=1 Tax=Paenibacillus sophorae TaxID=1333845 RepID=A0A1H8RTN2_9BACL|nr:hypothetical protein SAMN04487895_11077 [Paenibacillus sophorae]
MICIYCLWRTLLLGAKAATFHFSNNKYSTNVEPDRPQICDSFNHD